MIVSFKKKTMGHYERTARFELQKTNRKRKKMRSVFITIVLGKKMFQMNLSFMTINLNLFSGW